MGNGTEFAALVGGNAKILVTYPKNSTMRSSLRLLAPALRNAAASSRASSSRAGFLFGAAVAGGTLAYALVPHKQTLMLDAPGAQSLSFYFVA